MYWSKYNNQNIDVQYSPYIFNDDTYFWLCVFCPLLENIRIELGLKKTSLWTRSPDGQHDFHMTIGNVKHLK
jgi:hypothetical protein